MIGQNPRLLKSGYHPKDYFKAMWDTISGGEIWHGTRARHPRASHEEEQDIQQASQRDQRGGGGLVDAVHVGQDIGDLGINAVVAG